MNQPLCRPPRLARLVPCLAIAFALAPGCASTEGEPNKPSPRVGRDDAPPPTPNASVAIASVSMIEDCPHQDQAQEAPDAGAARPAAMSEPAGELAQGRGGPGGWDQCTQSMLQLAFKSTGDGPASVAVGEVRLVIPGKDRVVGTVAARKPMHWSEPDGYRPWDEHLPKGAELQASYKLSVPDWSRVDQAIGTSSFGFMFVLEVDVEIDGVLQTVRSPEFPREEAHVVVT